MLLRRLKMSNVNGKDEQRDPRLDGFLETSRYDFEEVLGEGGWGLVAEAKDRATGRNWALKKLHMKPTAEEQLEARDLTPFEAIQKEGDIDVASDHLVPRSFEIDENGRPYIRMPVYKTFLSDEWGELDEQRRLRRVEDRKSVNKGSLGLETVMDAVRDIAKGVGALHQVGKVHADVKPDNVAYDFRTNKHRVNDLGTSTMVSLGWAANRSDKDDPRGFEFSRAPEAFSREPQSYSDVWATSANLYRAVTGEWPYEAELSGLTSDEREQFMKEQGTDGLNKIIRRKIRKNVLSKGRLRSLLRKGLNADPWKRQPDGRELARDIEKTKKSFSVLHETWYAVKVRGGLAAAIGIAGAVTIGALAYDWPRGTRVEGRPQFQGLLYLEGNQDGKEVGFDAEQLNFLSKPLVGIYSVKERWSKEVTDNRSVAYLTHCHRLALDSSRVGSSTTDYMNDFFNRHASDVEKRELTKKPMVFAVPAYAIEHTIELLQSRSEDGSVDLEDVCAISRLGNVKVERAKQAAGSERFLDYVGARDQFGKYIIPKREQEFLKHWLSYIHSQ
jgi:hypothetical protein